MEPASMGGGEYRRQLSALCKAAVRAAGAPFLAKLSIRKKAALLASVSLGGLALLWVRRRRGGPPPEPRGRSRSSRRCGRRNLSSIEEATTLADGTPLTPQQLGLMGMEALETVVGYWEDALSAYATSRSNRRLMSPEETELVRKLESILEGSYGLQDEAEAMFIHEHSILNREKKKNRRFEGRSSKDEGYHLYKGCSDRLDGGPQEAAGSRNHLLSVSTVDQESFASALDTIADMEDFDDLFCDNEDEDDLELYNQALRHLEAAGIPCRVVRTEFVGCASDAEYLAKLHCLRLAFKRIMEDETLRSWWADAGRRVLSDLLRQADKDPKDFEQAYDDMLQFLNGPDDNAASMADELASKNVKCANNFYDVAFDYVLLDSFDDLESPPASVAAVMRNRWLSNGFKETALQTAVWSVLAAKRRMLKRPDGFKARFYDISEALVPTLAWGFFGPDEQLNAVVGCFKEQVMGLVRDMYDFGRVRFASVDAIVRDVMAVSKARLEDSVRQAEQLRRKQRRRLHDDEEEDKRLALSCQPAVPSS